MSVLSIRYSELDDVIKDAGKTKAALRDTANDLQNLIAFKLNRVSGEDAAGNVSTAATLALKKAEAMRDKSDAFKRFASDVDALWDEAKDKDSQAASEINSIADDFLGDQSFFERAVSSTYGLFVDVKNWIEDSGELGNLFVSAISAGTNKLAQLWEDAKNWFKYGDGQYVLNIAKAVADVMAPVIAIAGMAIVGSVPLMIIALISGGIWLLCSCGDMAATVENNTTAILNRDSPGIARYYSKATGVSGFVKTHDFGGISANYRAEVASGIHDVTRETAKTVNSIANMAIGLDSLSNVYADAGRTTVVSYDHSIENIKKNLQYNLYATKLKSGFTYTYSSVNPYEAKEGFSVFKMVGKQFFSPPEGIEGKLKIFTKGVDLLDTAVNGDENLATIKDFFDEPDSYWNGEDGKHIAKVVKSITSYADKTPLKEFKSNYFDFIFDPIYNAFEISAVAE